MEDLDDWNQNRSRYFVVDQCNPGLTDLFLKMARHDFLLTQPLTKEDIMQEAGRVLRSFQGQQEPNSPEGTQFMVQLSADFLARAGSKDQDRLMKMLPFPSLSLHTQGPPRRICVYCQGRKPGPASPPRQASVGISSGKSLMPQSLPPPAKKVQER